MHIYIYTPHTHTHTPTHAHTNTCINTPHTHTHTTCKCMCTHTIRQLLSQGADAAMTSPLGQHWWSCDPVCSWKGVPMHFQLSPGSWVWGWMLRSGSPSCRNWNEKMASEVVQYSDAPLTDSYGIHTAPVYNHRHEKSQALLPDYCLDLSKYCTLC